MFLVFPFVVVLFGYIVGCSMSCSTPSGVPVFLEVGLHVGYGFFYTAVLGGF